MMGIVMPETCWAYKKYNKIISGIYLVLYTSVIAMMHRPINIRFLYIYCLRNTYQNEGEFVGSVMLKPVLNIQLK